MAITDRSSKQSLTVLTVGIACFAVLWPKVFYPMVQSILFPTETDDQNYFRSINLNEMLHSQMRETMGEARPPDKVSKEKVWIHPSIRQVSKPQSKGAGAVNLVIPMYTIGIIWFFIYTFIKVILKKPGDDIYTCGKTNMLSSNICQYTEVDQTEKLKGYQDGKAQRALDLYGKHKVLSALKTVILEMEEFKENLLVDAIKPDIHLKSKVTVLHSGGS